MLKDFREFAVKGNVVDMAVGIIIGAAFTTVVKSVVDDLFMPLLSVPTGGLDFAEKFIVLRSGATPPPYTSLQVAKTAGAVVLSYGRFMNSVVSFLLVSLALFFLVRWMNKLRRPDGTPAPTTKPCQFCKQVIDVAATRCPHCTSNFA
jgi:large conductance mechanosensitive channel